MYSCLVFDITHHHLAINMNEYVNTTQKFRAEIIIHCASIHIQEDGLEQWFSTGFAAGPKLNNAVWLRPNIHITKNNRQNTIWGTIFHAMVILNVVII